MFKRIRDENGNSIVKHKFKLGPIRTYIDNGRYEIIGVHDNTNKPYYYDATYFYDLLDRKTGKVYDLLTYKEVKAVVNENPVDKKVVFFIDWFKARNIWTTTKQKNKIRTDLSETELKMLENVVDMRMLNPRAFEHLGMYSPLELQGAAEYLFKNICGEDEEELIDPECHQYLISTSRTPR